MGYCLLIAFLIFLYARWDVCAHRDERIVVGAKGDLESQLLAELIAIHLSQTEGLVVERKFGLDGFFAFEALKNGDIDLYPEFTGTALECLLHETAPAGAKGGHKLAQEEFKKRYGLGVSPMLGVDCGYCFFMKRTRAKALGITKLSELAALIEAERVHVGFYPEYVSRSEYQRWKEGYGISCRFKPDLIDQDIGFLALGKGMIDVVIGSETSSKADALDLVPLIDDAKVLPSYGGFILYRQKGELMASLENVVTNEDLKQLHRLVEIEGMEVGDVVRNFYFQKMDDQGRISPSFTHLR
ncbi:MAG: Osmoprotectant-binding protein OsmX [Chlamydiia bacterium]|nr:Osmoprotectant-binding protein OsmX [Chlamydiia bacterium]